MECSALTAKPSQYPLSAKETWRIMSSKTFASRRFPSWQADGFGKYTAKYKADTAGQREWHLKNCKSCCFVVPFKCWFYCSIFLHLQRFCYFPTSPFWNAQFIIQANIAPGFQKTITTTLNNILPSSPLEIALTVPCSVGAVCLVNYNSTACFSTCLSCNLFLSGVLCSVLSSSSTPLLLLE